MLGINYNSFFHTEVCIVMTIFTFIVGIHPLLAVVIITLSKGGGRAKCAYASRNSQLSPKKLPFVSSVKP